MQKSEKGNSTLTSIANSLKHSTDLRQRQGVLSGKRVDFFKGKHIVNCLLREEYSKTSVYKLHPTPDRESAITLCQLLYSGHYFLKADKPPASKFLTIVPVQPAEFNQDSYYFWVYEGSQWRGMLMGTGVLLVLFAGVMFPLWPSLPRQGVYYLSLVLLGFVGFIMALGVIRAILWMALKLTIGRGGWLFPNLFADVGFFESFVPLWKWDKIVRKAVAISENMDDDAD